MRRLFIVALVLLAGVVAFVGLDRLVAPAAKPKQETVRRDAKGRMERRPTLDGRVALYAYDKAGRIARISYRSVGRFTGWTYPGGDDIRFAYDAAGNRTETADATGTTRYTYDDEGRASSTTTPDGWTVSYEYDPWSRIHKMDYAGGERVEYAHDPFGQILCASGRRGGAVRFDYGSGSVTQRNLPNGIQTQFEKSPNGLLAAITHRKKNGMLIAQFRYTYDDESRVQSVEEQTPRGVRVIRYRYDPLGRLITVDEPGSATAYAYDPLGNRVSESTSRGAVRYQYDRAGRLVSAGEAQYTYDHDGNLTARSGRDAAHYEYDAEGRLVGVKRGDVAVHYVYDGEGNRVAREADGETMHFALHRFASVPQVIADLDENGGLVRQYILTGSRNVQLEPDGRKLYLLEDRMGSTRFVVDEKGDVVAHYDYSPFGVPRLVEGRDATRFLFGGEEWDDAAQLIFLRARYYDPSSGRFLTVDPVDGDPSDPQSYNSYAYAGNDPVNRNDPTGLQSSKYRPPPPPPPLTNTNYDIYRRNDTAHLLPQILPPSPPSIYYKDNRPWNWPSSTSPYDVHTSISPFHMPASYYYKPPVSSWRPMPQYPMIMGPSSWYDVFTRYDTPKIDPRYNVTTSRRDYWRDAELFVYGGTAVCAFCFPEALPFFKGATEMFAWGNVIRNTINRDIVGLAGDLFWHRFDRWAGDYFTHGILNSAERGSVLRRLDAWGGIRDYVTTRWGQPWDIQFDFRPRQREDEDLPHSLARFDPLILGTLDRRNLFFHPPPGGGDGGGGGLFYAPAVGGVYLDQTAKVIGNLGEIKGAMYDEKSGRLILIGNRRASALPPMRAEYLGAALRAVYGDNPHEPGMTIDPDPQDPHASLMHVLFFGGTENTRLGWVMFEADRLMKGYSIGRDNVTRAAVQSRVPGYRSVTSMGLADPQPDRGLWSRFWLIPEPVTARVSGDGRAIELDPIRMRVKTETMRWAGNQLVSAGGIKDVHAENFARHFTEHYADYEKESAIYSELRQVTAAVALAKWMKESEIPLDRNLAGLMRKPYPTPSRTPAAYSEESKTTSRGYSIETLRVFTFGGVEMAPAIRADRGRQGDSFRNAIAGAWADAQRESKETFPVHAGGQDLLAVALPSSSEPQFGGYDLTETDLPAAADRFGRLPGLVRSYNSFHNEPTELGHAWTLLLPRLEFESAGSKGERRYLSVEGREDTRVLIRKFILTNDYGIAPVTFEEPFVDQNLQRIGFRAKHSTMYRAIYPEGADTFRLFFRDGNQALFHSTGKLLAYLTPDSKALYEYDGRGRLSAIRRSTPSGPDDVVYTSDDSGRITSIAAAGEGASFDYDGGGNLVHVRSPRGDVVYRYDSRHFLTGVARNGVIVAENRYDDAGRVIERRDTAGVRSEQLKAASGGERIVEVKQDGYLIRRHYDANMRLTKIDGGDNGSLSFQYAGGGATLDRELPDGGHARATLDEKGRLREIEDPRGIRTQMRYRADGLPQEMLVNGRNAATYRYDANNRLIDVLYHGGWRESFTWDAAGRLTNYQRASHCDPSNVAIRYDAGGDLDAIGTSSLGQFDWSSGAMPSEPVAGWRTEMRGDRVVVTSPGGTQTQMIYNKKALLEAVIDPMSGRTTFTYDDRGLTRVKLPGGYCREYSPTVPQEWTPCGESGKAAAPYRN
jgi:RHS repeat-associated protein